MTQEEVADSIGVSTSAVGMYEQNRRTPDAETMDRIAVFYGVSVDYLLGRTDERRPYGENSAEALALLREKDGIYFHFAARAKALDLSKEDMEYILNSYRELRKP